MNDDERRDPEGGTDGGAANGGTTDGTTAAWREQLLANRDEKDRFLADHPQSPLPPEERDGFDGLPYFDPDPDYRVTARVERHADPEAIAVETTTGGELRYERVATLHFTLGGEERTLHGYRRTGGEDTLFVPFRDKTSGQQTSRYGRYMELAVDGGTDALPDAVTLDFNLAYSPFCVYTEAFECPLPPEENWLETVVAAGERVDE